MRGWQCGVIKRAEIGCADAQSNFENHCRIHGVKMVFMRLNKFKQHNEIRIRRINGDQSRQSTEIDHLHSCK